MQDEAMQESAAIEQLKMQIRQRLDKYVSLKNVAYNPDIDIVEQLITGLAQRQQKFNRAYCPCRRPTGNPREDAKIICPCFYSKEELARDGACLCGLFVTQETSGDDNG